MRNCLEPPAGCTSELIGLCNAIARLLSLIIKYDTLLGRLVNLLTGAKCALRAGTWQLNHCLSGRDPMEMMISTGQGQERSKDN